MTRFRDGQEAESGTVRSATPRIRGRRDDSGVGEEAWHAPTDGAPGDQQCHPTREEDERPGPSEARSGERVHRSDAGFRSRGPAQAAAHSASNLDAIAGRAFGTCD